MTDEVVNEEAIEEVDEASDDLGVDADISDIAEYLANEDGYPSDSEEELEEEVEEPVEEEEQVSQETESEEDGETEYYTMEEFTELSDSDIIDGKFDSSKVKPGSLVEKFVKGFERAYTKKFTDVAELKKEVLETKAKLDLLKAEKSFDADSFFEKQKQHEEQKRLQEEEALLTDEEREAVQQKREMQSKLDEYNAKIEQTQKELYEMKIQSINAKLTADIAKAGLKHNIDVDAENDRIQREIAFTWDSDKASGKEPGNYTPVEQIIQRVADSIKKEKAPVLTDDFWETEEGIKMKEKLLRDEFAKVKKMKKSGGKVAPSSSKSVSSSDIVDTGVDLSQLDDSNFEHYIITGEMPKS